MPGSNKPRPKSTGKDRTPKSVKAQLQGKRCNHDKTTIMTNSKGRQFKQCLQCPAFLGWVD